MTYPAQRVGIGAAAIGRQLPEDAHVEKSAFQKAANSVGEFGCAIKSAAGKFLNGIKVMVTSSTNGGVAIQKIAKLALALLMATERLVMGTDFYVKHALGITDNYVDGIQIVSDINTLVKGKFKKFWNEGICSFGAAVTLTLCNLGSAMLLAESPLKLVKWANVAAAMGKFRVFSTQIFAVFNKISLEAFVRTNVVIGLTLLSIHTIMQMRKGGDLTSAKLTLLHAMPEILLQLVLLAGMVGVAVHVIRLAAALTDLIKLHNTVQNEALKTIKA